MYIGDYFQLITIINLNRKFETCLTEVGKIEGKRRPRQSYLNRIMDKMVLALY